MQTRASNSRAADEPSKRGSPIDEAGQLAWWRERARGERDGRSELWWSFPPWSPAGGCGYLHIEMGGQVSNFTRNGWHHLA